MAVNTEIVTSRYNTQQIKDDIMTENSMQANAELANLAPNNWLNYLATQGAIVQNETVTSFGNLADELLATTDGSIMCDLSHLGLLEIDGADAVTFLQGQVTNDVSLLDGSNSHYTGYCNPKGRLLALFLAFSHYNHVHLQLSRELVAPIMKRLKMYVIRSKVEIKDSSANIIKIGVNGTDVQKLLSGLFTQVPQNEYDLVSLTNGALIKLPSSQNHSQDCNQERYEIFTDIEHAPAIWIALKKHCTPVGKACWDYLEIEAGIPDVVIKTQEEFVPQMLNLDLINAINFKKGCYTGQEIVARTHYLGKVKRRTLRASIKTNALPEAGDDILNSAQEVVGKIVRSAPMLNDTASLLVELRLDNVAMDNLEHSTLAWQGHALSLHAENALLLSTGTAEG